VVAGTAAAVDTVAVVTAAAQERTVDNQRMVVVVAEPQDTPGCEAWLRGREQH
jgi:hypothetical protein